MSALIKSFEGMTLDPEEAINGIESLLNAGMFLNLSDHHKEFGNQILTIAYDYVAAIKENRETGK